MKSVIGWWNEHDPDGSLTPLYIFFADEHYIYYCIDGQDGECMFAPMGMFSKIKRRGDLTRIAK
jgi:hypothetical protein